MIREPIAAGLYYPGEASQLRDMIESMVDPGARKVDAVGALVPHAGYPYSGPVTGAVISRLKFTDTFIIIGPSHTGAGKPFSIMTEGTWQTPLGDVEIDAWLAGQITAVSRYLQEDSLAHRQEHAVEVQLPFLQYFKPDVKIVPIVLSLAPAEVYEAIGREIAEALKETHREAVILASGDMTHYEPQEAAAEKDAKAVEALLALDAREFTRRYEELHITMCAHGPAVSLITAAVALGAPSAELVKYQTSGDATGDYNAVVGYAGVIIKSNGEHPLVRLARQTVEKYVREGRPPAPPTHPTREMRAQAGVFVSIHKQGDLRGCIGTFEPQQRSVAEEIITNAVSSATRDPRFNPVEPDELPDLDYSVDVLTEPEPVQDESELDPKKYGVIVEAGWRRGLLLPDLAGVDTVAEQLGICRQKAGIGPDEPVKLYRFEVKRYK